MIILGALEALPLKMLRRLTKLRGARNEVLPEKTLPHPSLDLRRILRRQRRAPRLLSLRDLPGEERRMSFHVPERRRVLDGPLRSSTENGNNGAFVIQFNPGSILHIIASDGCGWEHVSVTVRGENRTPTWSEMCFVKDSFWDKEDCVMQLHPPESDYINNHPYCLHLWRPTGDVEIPTPPSSFVGAKSKNLQR